MKQYGFRGTLLMGYKVVPHANNSHFTMVYGTQITIVFMGFINQQTSLGGTILQDGAPVRCCVQLPEKNMAEFDVFWWI